MKGKLWTSRLYFAYDTQRSAVLMKQLVVGNVFWFCGSMRFEESRKNNCWLIATKNICRQMRALLSGCDRLLALANSHSYFCKLLFKRREDSKLDFFFLDGARNWTKMSYTVSCSLSFFRLIIFKFIEIFMHFLLQLLFCRRFYSF